jgi:Glycosyl transferase family 2
MSTLTAHTAAPPSQSHRTQVDIVVPVYNEAATLRRSVVRLREYLDRSFPLSAQVTIADNASTDGTYDVAVAVARELRGVRVVHLAEKGRGRALRAAWGASSADVVAYMDVDLSTGLDALLPLVAPLVSGHSDLAIGTRLAPGARVTRGPKREVISRCYNLLVRTVLGNSFSDAQCGFKAMRREAAQALLPLVRDNEWFFDTELLVLAERNGLRIHEVPVDWVDDPDSRVDVARTAIGDLRGIARLVREFSAGRGWAQLPTPARQERARQTLRRVAGVGLVSTLAFLVLFLLLRPVAGVWAADVLALAICSVGNTWTHVRLNAGQPDPTSHRRFVLGGLTVFATNAVFTLMALWVAQTLLGGSAVADLFAVTAGTVVAGFARLVALRALGPRDPFAGHPAAEGPALANGAATTAAVDRAVAPVLDPNRDQGSQQ